MTKICNRCGEEKPATTDYFRKAKTCKDGFRGQCKVCLSEYHKKYAEKNAVAISKQKKRHYQENQDRIKEYAKEHYKENQEHYKQQHKQYRQENQEYFNQYGKQHRQENPDYYKQYGKRYRQENADKLKEYFKQHYKENRHKYVICSQRRKAKIRSLPATLTTEQWQQIKVDFNNKCAYCGMTEEEHRKRFNEQLHQEHFIPLFKGGEYTHNNIIPACKSCNSSKQDTDFFEWYPTYEEYNEEREQFILEYLGYIEDTQQLTLESTFTETQKDHSVATNYLWHEQQLIRSC